MGKDEGHLDFLTLDDYFTSRGRRCSFMNGKTKIMPNVYFSHDDQGGRLKIEVELPGVDRKDINLDMRKDSFCVSAPRGDTEYSGCFILAHEVQPDKTEAKFESGLLRVFAPIKGWEEKVKVQVR
jgi:HSP20 family protein